MVAPTTGVVERLLALILPRTLPFIDPSLPSVAVSSWASPVEMSKDCDVAWHPAAATSMEYCPSLAVVVVARRSGKFTTRLPFASLSPNSVCDVKFDVRLNVTRARSGVEVVVVPALSVKLHSTVTASEPSFSSVWSRFTVPPGATVNVRDGTLTNPARVYEIVYVPGRMPFVVGVVRRESRTPMMPLLSTVNDTPVLAGEVIVMATCVLSSVAVDGS